MAKGKSYDKEFKSEDQKNKKLQKRMRDLEEKNTI